MRLTAKEVAEITGGTLAGPADTVVTGAAGLDDAGPSDISFLGNPKYASRLSETRAGLVLVPEATGSIDRALVRVRNPQLAFARILEIIDRERREATRPDGVHPTAVIARGAKLGRDCVVGAFSVIHEGAVLGDRVTIYEHCSVGRESVIGDDSMLYPNVTIREKCSIGRRAILHPGVVIGGDGFGFVPTPAGTFKIPQIGSVVIGDDVEIGSNSTVDRATTGATRIGNGTKIDNLVMIAHNVQIGSNCMIVAQVGIAGSTVIGNNVTLAGQSGTVGHLKIGDGVVVAARAGVTTDVAPKEVVSGYPALPHREDLKIQATLRRLPKIVDGIKKMMKGNDQHQG